MSELAQLFTGLNADVSAAIEKADHDMKQREIGYQDAMRDLRECITETGETRTAVALWLEHGREWRQ